MNPEQYGDALGAAMREIMRLDAEAAQLKADKALMHELIASANERIRGLMAANADLVEALVEVADPCCVRTGEGFRIIARAALAKATKEQP